MNLLQIMSFMADNNLDISKSDTFVEGKSVKQGAHITMGVDLKTLINIQTDKYVPVLFCLNREQYDLLHKDVVNLDLLRDKEK